MSALVTVGEVETEKSISFASQHCFAIFCNNLPHVGQTNICYLLSILLYIISGIDIPLQ